MKKLPNEIDWRQLQLQWKKIVQPRCNKGTYSNYVL